ncbi:MAG: hypothetical protein GC192_02100 [Bacteroidetes bacterium]|nr:hypothetical protein [Bacteroidota bacterium]
MSIIHPFSLFWIIIIFSSFLKWKRKKRLSDIFFKIALGWLIIISTGFVPNYLIGLLERQYKPLTNFKSVQKKSATLIMVLGAGHTYNPNLQINNQLSETELARLVEGLRIYRAIPNSRLVTSGSKGSQNQSQAALVRLVAIELGVDAVDIDTLSRTTNTEDEAHFFRQTYGTDNTLILVTDAIHMPRAMMRFRAKGLNPIPAPTNTRLKEEKSNRSYLLVPNIANIEKMGKALHEFLGIFWMEINS